MMMHSLFRNQNLRMKVILIVGTTSLMLVLFVCLLVYKIVVQGNEEMLQHSIGNILTHSADMIGKDLSTAETLSNVLYSDNVIQTELYSMEYNNVISLNSKSNIAAVLQHYAEQYQAINLLYIRVASGHFSYSTNDLVSNREEPALIQALEQQADLADGALTVHTVGGDSPRLYLTRTIRQIESFSMKKLGYITLCIDITQMIQKVTKFSNAYDETLFVLRNGSEDLYRSKNLPTQVRDELSHIGQNEYGIITVGKTPYFCIAGTLLNYTAGTRGVYDWDYYCLISYAKTAWEIYRTFTIFVFISVLLIFLDMLLVDRLFSPVTARIKHLVSRMQAFHGTEPVAVLKEYQDHRDEIDLLHRQFEKMGNKTYALIKENYEKELLAKAAEMKALQMQVNPHFLYNVLDSIHWRARLAGLVEISNMVESLGILMRGAVDNSRDTITIREEITYVNHYVRIQHLRFEDNLVWRSEVDASAYDVLVPKLSIQPLVDNAIRYGMAEQYEDPCTVSLTVKKTEDQCLTIRVMNTGSQFEEDLLEKLRRHEVEPHGSGIGLVNIDKRFRLMYGDSFGLQLYNCNDLAVAMIRLPVLRRETKNAENADS